MLTNAGRYVTAIAAGDDELAYRIARLPNPFPSICGRVCAAPCEKACRRGSIDEPIAIRALKRYVCEQFGVESGHGARVYARRGADGAGAGRARGDRRRGSGGHGLRARPGHVRLPPGGVRGAGPARRHDGAGHPALPAPPRICSRTRSARSWTWASSCARAGARPGLLAALPAGRRVRGGVPGHRVHARARPADPRRRARRRAARRRLPVEREPGLPGGAGRRRAS